MVHPPFSVLLTSRRSVCFAVGVALFRGATTGRLVRKTKKAKPMPELFANLRLGTHHAGPYRRRLHAHLPAQTLRAGT